MADISKEITGDLRIAEEENETLSREIKSVPDFDSKSEKKLKKPEKDRE